MIDDVIGGITLLAVLVIGCITVLVCVIGDSRDCDMIDVIGLLLCVIGDEGMIGEGTVGGTLIMELCPSFCSDELFEPGLTVGSGRFSNLNLKFFN